MDMRPDRQLYALVGIVYFYGDSPERVEFCVWQTPDSTVVAHIHNDAADLAFPIQPRAFVALRRPLRVVVIVGNQILEPAIFASVRLGTVFDHQPVGKLDEWIKRLERHPADLVNAAAVYVIRAPLRVEFSQVAVCVDYYGYLVGFVGLDTRAEIKPTIIHPALAVA